MKTTHLVLLLTLSCGATALAVDPPPDGGYPIRNTAEGEDALFSLTSGYNNTAVGFDALLSNTTGFHNTAIGSSALLHNTKGVANTAIGLDALKSNSIGKANVAFGVEALLDNTAGFRNIAIGTESLKKTTGNDNVGLGYEAGMNVTTGSFTICIGHMGLASDTNMIRIGTEGIQTTTFVAGIKDTPVVGAAVVITTDGQLGVSTSSARFKEAIKPMDKASEAIFSLHPVTFRYRNEVDPNGIPQFGLVAEQVEKADPNLVARDDRGKPYTVRYEAVNAMLLNEFLKEHRKVEKLEATVARQQSDFASALAQQGKEIEALISQIHKVSEQVAMSNAAPRLVNNQ
jgi:trimeric autotransporter adhesin